MLISVSLNRVLCLLALLALPVAAAPLKNQLAEHPSPYLALHGHDPVAWQEWNAETLARAKRENKPLFVSVGYFSCHWCHVMQRESYSDLAIAALLNRHFIPVKVDRELNGALDAALLDFAEHFRGAAGWPLNVVVTPEGYPAYAAIYLPPAELKVLLEGLAKTWAIQGEELGRAARQAGARRGAAPARGEVTAGVADELSSAFLLTSLQNGDLLQGGFGAVAKFPRPTQLGLLLDVYVDRRDAGLGDFLRLTLDRMAGLGLRDHVNGGFFRYTVDPDWMTPHFEKMLYDNAQLAVLYQRAATALRRPDYRDVAEAALDFMLRDLRTRGGGFMTSTSALDARGREGGAYLWSPEAVRKHLTPAEYRLVQRVWGLDTYRPFELGYLPLEKNPPTGTERPTLRRIYAKLQAAGRTATLPRDGKIGAGLNGLALSALSRAGKGAPRFEQAARQLYAYIDGQLVEKGRLLKARAGSRRFPEAELDDYAYVAAGLADYAAAFNTPGARRLALALARQAWARFYGPRGWRREEQPLLATMNPEAAPADGAVPSASAVLIAVSAGLGDRALRRRAAEALAMAVPVMQEAPFEHASGLAALRAVVARPD